MNENEKILLRYVCEGNMRRSQDQARIILNGIKTEKNKSFRDSMLRMLDKRKLIELPANVQHLLVAEDTTSFPTARFLLREQEKAATNRVIALYKASEQLEELGIPYLPAIILHGDSGCGKTMLARYIAHKVGLPFIYVQFSNLVESYLGKTQANIARIFEYARSSPCVLCFDEIDAVGMARGQKDDVGEMNRVVISIMQELDQCPNNLIIIGTTNRFDRLDPALVRRFPLNYRIEMLKPEEVKQLAYRFFDYAGVACDTWLHGWCDDTFAAEKAPASSVIRECTEVIVKHILDQSAREVPNAEMQ